MYLVTMVCQYLCPSNILQALTRIVYDLSLLASLPNSILPLLPPDGLPSPRSRPLFNVGIHDIPTLSTKNNPTEPNKESTWIACSTDSVLSMKPDLYDVLVTLPAPHTKDVPEKAYPVLSFLVPTKPGTPPSQAELKATQRDARRYARLRKGLRNLSNDENSCITAGTSATNFAAGGDDTDASSTYSSSPVVEPLSWTQLAYTSFIWWASAGEKREGLSEEEEELQIDQDTRLLASIENIAPQHSHSHAHAQQTPEDLDPDQRQQQQQQPAEVALVTYFRRLTAQIFVILADVIARHDGAPQDEQQQQDRGSQSATDEEPYRDDPDENETQETDDDRSPLLTQGDNNSPKSRTGTKGADRDTNEIVSITSEDMTEMGLDVWSLADRVFAEELVQLWWGRRASVDCARVRCCGITIL